MIESSLFCEEKDNERWLSFYPSLAKGFKNKMECPGGGSPRDQFLVPQELVIFQLLLHDETTLYCPTWQFSRAPKQQRSAPQLKSKLYLKFHF